MSYRRPLAIVTIIALVCGQFAPVAAALAANKKEGIGKDVRKKPVASVPAAQVPAADWSAVDWDKPIVLAQDAGAPQKGENKKLPTHRLSDDDMMMRMRVPADVQTLVRSYRDRRAALEKSGASQESLAREQQGLSAAIMVLHPGRGLDQKENAFVIDAAKATKGALSFRRANSKRVPSVKSVNVVNKPKSEYYDLTPESLKTNRKVLTKPQKLSVGAAVIDWIRNIVSTPANAASPLIAYYQGIENNTLDYALYYLSTQQNEDGSFGTADQYVTTYYVVMALAETNHGTDSDQFLSAVTYLANTTPETTRAKALKARLLWHAGGAFKNAATALMQEIEATRNADGGYGHAEGYTSDLLTTDEVALTFFLADYSLNDSVPAAVSYIVSAVENDGSVRHREDANASWYLLNRTLVTLQPMRGLVLQKGQNQVRLQSVIDTLLSYINNQYDPDAQSFVNATRSVDTILAVRNWRLNSTATSSVMALSKTIKSTQLSDGSFDESVEATAEALTALKTPDAVITSFKSVGSQTNRVTATFELTVVNNGYDTLGASKLSAFVDNYDNEWNVLLFDKIAVAPGGTAVYTILVPDTDSYFGVTNFKLFVQNPDDLNQDNNWVDKDFTFAADVNNYPAVPRYFEAQQMVSNNSAAIVVRWPNKPDSNRYDYVVMWREAGTQLWSYGSVANNSNAAFINNAKEGKKYEVQFGLRDKTENLTLYVLPQLVEVTTTADDTKYRGSVSATIIDGNSPGVAEVLNLGEQTVAMDGSAATTTLIRNGFITGRVNDTQYDRLRVGFTVTPGATTNVAITEHLTFDTTPPVVDSFSVSPSANFIIKNSRTVDIFAHATDNVSVRDGDFYFWDPAVGYWAFLGTVATDRNQQFKFPWYVTNDLLGQGYKLKVVAHDYRGNASAEKIWGPFAIADGTAPSFIISSPKGGDTWLLNTTNTIAWTTSSTNPVNKVSLRFIYKNNIQFLASNINNTGSYSYKIPFNSLYAGSPVQIRITGTDSGNGEEGSNNSDPFTIADSSPAPTAPWKTAELLADDMTASTTNAIVDKDNVQVAVDADGTTHLVYRVTIDNVAVVPRTILEYLVYRRLVNGVWSQPLVFNERTFTIVNNVFDTYTPVVDARLAVDKDHQVHLVWMQNSLGTCAAQNGQEIYYQKYDGNVWSNPVNLSNNATASNGPAIASAPNGSIAVAWTDGLTWDAQCKSVGQKTVETRLLQNNNWQNLGSISEAGRVYNPQLAFSPDNSLHVAYIVGTAVALERDYNGAWGAPHTLVTSDALEHGSLTAGPDGALHFVVDDWYYDGNFLASRVWYASTNNGVWQPASVISPVQARPGDAYNYPYISINQNKHAVVTYNAFNEGKGVRQVEGVLLAPGHSLPMSISPKSQFVEDGSLSAAAFGATAATAWTTSYSYGTEIFFGSADFGSEYITPDPVTNAVVTTTLNRAVVTWALYDDAFKITDHFAIYRTQAPTASVKGLVPLATINSVTSTRYIDDAGIGGTTYYYYVTAVTKGGNESDLAEAGSVVYPSFNGVVYEDAEDLLVSRWVFLGAGSSTIANVPDDAAHGRAVQITNADIYNQNYELLVNGKNDWNNQTGKTLRFDIKTNDEVRLFARVISGGQSYYVMYSFTAPLGIQLGRYASLRLDPSLKDGQWHTVVRDVRADFASVFPNKPVQSIEHFIAGGSSVRIDNVALRNDSLLHQISGTILDENNKPVPNTTISVTPGNTTVTTNGAGEYLIGSLSDGVYTLVPHSEDFTFTPASTAVVLSGTNEISNFAAKKINTYVYEDAEDGGVNKWEAYLAGKPGTITNIDEPGHSRVIEVKLTEPLAQSYTLYGQDGHTGWHNTKATVLKFDLKTQTEGYYFARVETQVGAYYLMYSFNYPTGMRFGRYVSINLDPSLKDGQWHTVERDLQADLATLVPNTPIVSVEHFIAESTNARLDNILLTSEKSVYNVGGVVKNGNAVVAGLPITLLPSGATATTDEQGRYRFSNLTPGQYQLTVDKRLPYELNPEVVGVQVTNDDVATDIAAKPRVQYVYEDAEAGNTARWQLLGPNLQGTSISVVNDSAPYGKVIEIKTPDIANQNFMLQNEQHANWHNVSSAVVQFDLKTQNEVRAFVRVETGGQAYYLMYSFDYPTGLRWGNYASLNLNPSLRDGQWHTVTRDLQADLDSIVPGKKIVSVEYFIFGSQNARVDNISLRSDSIVHQISGTITDEQNQPASNVAVRLSPGDVVVTTDNTGNYSFGQLLDGTYQITPSASDYEFSPVSTEVVLLGQNAVANFSMAPKTHYLYEDGEDGLVARWELVGSNPPGTSIANVSGDVQHGRVIEIATPDIYNQNYWLFGPDGITPWHNTKATKLSFDIKTAQDMFLYIAVNTDQGTLYLMYSFNYPYTGLIRGGRYISINLDPNVKDGQWHTVERDLAADIHAALPNVTVTSIDNMLVSSPSISLDNISLNR